MENVVLTIRYDNILVVILLCLPRIKNIIYIQVYLLYKEFLKCIIFYGYFHLFPLVSLYPSFPFFFPQAKKQNTIAKKMADIIIIIRIILECTDNQIYIIYTRMHFALFFPIIYANAMAKMSERNDTRSSSFFKSIELS